MFSFSKKFSKIKVKICLSLMLICSLSSLNVSAATKEDALTAVVNFLQAQKTCNVEVMMSHSQHLVKIENMKEAFTRFCSEHPLQQAKITNISIINKEAALVSIQSTYKDMVSLKTSPVIKIDGQWKIVMGIPPSGSKNINSRNRVGKEVEVEKVFKDYSEAIKAHDIQKMKTFIKLFPNSNNEKLENHLKALTQQPTPDVTPYGIRMISDSLAVAQIEIKNPNYCYSQTLAVCNENGNWKVVFGHPLTNAFIPKSGNLVDIK